MSEPITQADLAAAVQAAGLSAQVTHLQGDITEIKAEARLWREAHEHEHKEERETRSARHSANLRLAVSLAVTLLTSQGGIFWYLVTHVHR